jgi:hypothetical protein
MFGTFERVDATKGEVLPLAELDARGAFLRFRCRVFTFSFRVPISGEPTARKYHRRILQ